MENSSFFHNAFLGDGLCNVLDGQMGGDKGYTQCLVHQNHQRLMTFTHASLDILRMARKMKAWALNGSLVDGGCHQHVIELAAIVCHSAVECFQGSCTSFLRGLPELYFRLFIETGQEIQASVASLLGTIDDGKGNLQIECFAMIGSNLG